MSTLVIPLFSLCIILGASAGCETRRPETSRPAPSIRSGRRAKSPPHDDTPYFGIWGIWGDTYRINNADKPWYKGVLVSVPWKKIEPADNRFEWAALDNKIREAASNGLYVMVMVYGADKSPDWIYERHAIRRIVDGEKRGQPYYLDEAYPLLFKRMIKRVARHLDGDFPPVIRKKIIAVQGTVGKSGDTQPYRGKNRYGKGKWYEIPKERWKEYTKEMFRAYVDAYKDTEPKIHVLLNTRLVHDWAIRELPGIWGKNGRVSHRYQSPGETRDPLLAAMRRNGGENAFRTRGEQEHVSGAKGEWFLEAPLWNIYWGALWCLHAGLDMWNHVDSSLNNPDFAPFFEFFSRYAGHKDPAYSPGAWVALRDGLDASNTARFPEAIYGPVKVPGKKRGEDGRRYASIAAAFAKYGARQSAPDCVGMRRCWKGLNDVAWCIHEGNYELFMRQIDPNGTSQGLWRQGSKDEPYGRFARRFDHASGRDAIYFDLDDDFFSRQQPNAAGGYSVDIRVVYLDRGRGKWELRYDAVDNNCKRAMEVEKTDTGRWKEKTVTVKDGRFRNGCPRGADIILVNTDAEDDTFHMVEVIRQKS